MTIDKTIKTDRLILRPWIQEDLEPFSKLNADPRVREFFPNVLKSAKNLSRVKK